MFLTGTYEDEDMKKGPLFSRKFSFSKVLSRHVRESKTLLDSEFHAVDSGFHLLDSRSFSVELGFRIRIVSGIPDSYTCIPDSKAQDSGFHEQKFPRFRIPESGFLYMGRVLLGSVSGKT